MDLNQKLDTIRAEEVESRSRAAAIAKSAEERELNTDELAELGEIETKINTSQEQQRGIKSALNIGDYHPEVNAPIGMDEKEVRQFSMLKMIKAQARGATRQDVADASLEMEASKAVEKRIGVSPNGMYIPMEIMGGAEKRDLTADNFTQAGALVGVDFRPQQLIPLLRNAMALANAGATVLDGLVGDVAIPKQTGAATASWVNSDGGSISEGNQSVAQVTLTPRTLGVFTDYSRQLRLQSSVSVENFVRQDLMTVVALEKDRAGLHGTGAAGQPVGVQNTTGVGTQAFAGGANPTRAEVVGMRGDLATANALAANLKFITNSTVYGNMMNRLVDAGSGQFLLQENGSVIGRPVVESNQVAAGVMFFGNWADLLIANWGGMDLLVDPYVGATAGNVRVLLFHSTDLAVRHAESFCIGS